MVYEYYDKFEYSYVSLYSRIEPSIERLNELGKEGWELVKLFEPQTVEQYKAILKRKIMSINA